MGSAKSVFFFDCNGDLLFFAKTHYFSEFCIYYAGMRDRVRLRKEHQIEKNRPNGVDLQAEITPSGQVPAEPLHSDQSKVADIFAMSESRSSSTGAS
jgi:hypothetical protein